MLGQAISKTREGGRGGGGEPPTKRVRLHAQSRTGTTGNATGTPETQNKTRTSVERPKFTSVAAIRAALSLSGDTAGQLDGRSAALTTLRSQFSLRHSEVLLHDRRVAPTDERLLLAQDWLAISPSLEEVFALWDAAHRSQQPTISSLALSLFTTLLTLLGPHPALRNAAQGLVRKLLSPVWLRRVNAYVVGGNNELVLVSLGLLGELARDWERRGVLEGFGWESKALVRLFTMRRRGVVGDPLIRPDIRTAYILFLLAFISPPPTTSSSASTAQIKTQFLTAHSAPFTGIFKGLAQDHPTLVRRVLEVCWVEVWNDRRVSKSVKVAVFGEGVISHILKLYDRTTNPPSNDQTEAEYTPADLAHHFLLGICTRSGVGVCFKDRGWYPRESGSDEGPSTTGGANERGERRGRNKNEGEGENHGNEEGRQGRGTIHNKILANVLKMLNPTEDPRQQELALKILGACPELVAGYIPNAGLTLDPPRLSSKWLVNLGFVVGVVGLGVPVESFLVGGGGADAGSFNGNLQGSGEGEGQGGTRKDQYNPTPPPLQAILGNIVPAGMKNVFTKGLQFVGPASVSASAASTTAATSVATTTPATTKTTTTGAPTGNLVQHTTCLALIRCLQKYERVKAMFGGVAMGLGEDIDDGLWTKRWQEVEKEVRRRVPEFQVVFAFWRNCASSAGPAATGSASIDTHVTATSGSSSNNATRAALLAESAMRLLWMYQRTLPEVVQEARFDVGKMVIGFGEGFGRAGCQQQQVGGEEEQEEGREGAREGNDTPQRLNRVVQLHLLRFLKESPQFVWMGKNSITGHTHLYTLLMQLVDLPPCTISTIDNSSAPTTHTYQTHIRTELASLIEHLLGSCILFQEDPEEVGLWLMCLPVRRGVGADGTRTLRQELGLEKGPRLIDERKPVIAFLDECVQRCLKTPYRYIEEMRAMCGRDGGNGDENRNDNEGEHTPGDERNSPAQSTADTVGAEAATGEETPPSSLPSPLLLTLLEQLEAKTKTKLSLAPLDVLAITAFLRKLVYRFLSRVDLWSTSSADSSGLGLALGSESPALKALRKVVERLDGVLSREGLFAASEQNARMLVDGEEDERIDNSEIVKGAVRREVRMMWRCLRVEHEEGQGGGAMDVDGVNGVGVDVFVDRVESWPPSRSAIERESVAYAFVDWLRLLPTPLNAAQLKRLGSVISKYSEPVLGELVQNLDIAGGEEEGGLWRVLDVVEEYEKLASYLPFEWLFLHTGPTQIVDERCRSVLVESTFPHTSNTNTCTALLKRVLRLIMYAFASWKQQGRDAACQGLLILLANIMERASASDKLSATHWASLKQMLFGPKSVLKGVILGRGLGPEISDGAVRLQEAALKATLAADRILVQDISRHWVNALKLALGEENPSVSIGFASTWIKYLEPAELFELLDDLSKRHDGQNNPRVVKVLGIGLEPLRLMAASDTHSEVSLSRRLPRLLQLRALLPTSHILEDLIAIAVGATIPVGLVERTSTSSPNGSPVQMSSVLERVETHWSQRAVAALPAEFCAREFLEQETWSEATVTIISGSLYKRALLDEGEFVSWLESEACRQRNAEHFVPVLHAFLDCAVARTVPLSTPTGDKNDVWSQHLSRLLAVAADANASRKLRKQAGECVHLVLSLLPSLDIKTPLLQIMDKKMITAEMMAVATGLQRKEVEGNKLVMGDVVEKGLQWAIRRLADDEHVSGLTKEVIEELTSLIELGPACKSATVETLLTVVVQQHLTESAALKLAKAALKSTNLKPLIVNRHLQSIVQHPHFFKICTAQTPELSRARDAIVDLLHVLFFLHPVNTCQVSHVEPLVRIYCGTLSPTDIKILSIFQLFEGQRKLSVASMFARWSPLDGGTSSTSLEALQALDSILVLRTALGFPLWRRLEDQSSHKISAQDAPLYDPVFSMLLFGQMLADNPPVSAIGWIELFRTNVVGIFIRALSSKDGQIRDLALGQIVALWKNLHEADLQERPHVLYILTLVKNVLPLPSTEQYPPRLPSYTTLLLFYALRGVFNPSSFTYPLTSRFLLQRPELDISDVPMLYGLLYSNSEDWKKERGWIVRFLADGMMSSQDWKVLKRRHTWDLLASMFQSSEHDLALRHGILDVLANLTNHPQAAMSLVLKSGLLSWIEMQLRLSTVDGVAWVKILENLLVSVDVGKLESSPLAGEWSGVICRCIGLLLEEAKSPVFPHAVPVIIRLSLLSGSTHPILSTLLNHALRSLKQLEANLKLPEQTSALHVPRLEDVILPAPHTSHGLHERCSIEDPLPVWGHSVEMLWRAVMNTSDDRRSSSVWDELTSRLLLWRSITEPNERSVGEWARVESVRNA